MDESYDDEDFDEDYEEEDDDEEDGMWMIMEKVEEEGEAAGAYTCSHFSSTSALPSTV